LHLLGYIVEAGKALVIVINKWDGLEADVKEQVKSELSRRLTFIQFAQIRFISALYGSGVGHLFKDILQAYASAIKKLSTPKLTRLLNDLVQQHSPPLVHGRQVKMRYAHAGGHNPPVIVIHGNQLQRLPDSYKRYLINGFTEHLALVGTPLKLEFVCSDNPYKDKRNKLTPRQIYQRKRLMKHVKKK
jgi:GTP-binding protein